MNLLFITIIETIYLYYMFHIFRTKYSFNHSFEFLVNNNLGDYFQHSIQSNDYRRKICKFGRDGSLVLILYLIIRFFIIKYDLISRNKINNFNKFILIFIFLLSWMNLNAVIYFLPFLIFDYYFLVN